MGDDRGSVLHARFGDFAALCEQLAGVSSRLIRTRLVADYLRGLSADEAEVATRWLAGRAFPEGEGRRLSVSGRAVWDALRTIGITIAEHHWRGAPDFGEIVRRVLEGRPSAAHALRFADIVETFNALATASGNGARQRRVARLARLFAGATPLEAKYLSKIIIGEMRHGVQEGILLDAIAALCSAKPTEVRRAQQALGDVGRLAYLAKTQGQAAVTAVVVELFRPVKPMLAQTAADIDEAMASMGGRWALEWKLDGARVQIHKDGDRVRLFSRRLKDVTPSLPEIVATVLQHAHAARAIFEGEVIPVMAAQAAGRPLAFQELMRRFRRIRDVPEAAAQIPVKLYLFDLLLLDDQVLLDAPESARWDALQSACGSLDCVAHLVPSSVAEARAFYQAALDAGHEGVMAKSLDAPYAPGIRGAGWLKIKKIVTLDLVIIAADWGYGRRHGWLSNYHLAARDPATGGFVPVGKTFKGLTDEQFRAMTERLLGLKVDERGGTVFVKPEVVVEVRFTDIQKSPQYACGMALRFARIYRIRDDKRAEDADTLDTLRALFEQGYHGAA